jgi:hypothetical protein
VRDEFVGDRDPGAAAADIETLVGLAVERGVLVAIAEVAVDASRTPPRAPLDMVMRGALTVKNKRPGCKFEPTGDSGEAAFTLSAVR